MGRWTMIAVGLLAMTGCTHAQLRHNTVRQARTVADLQQQQVMDNLAMFVYDANSFPYFAVPSQGTGEVTDKGSASTTLNWIPAGWSAAMFKFDGSRQAKQNWTLNPVNDPRRLELMRCAYQQAVANCGCGGVAYDCPDCRKRWNKFYTGDTATPSPEKTACVKRGIVDNTCLASPCWFQFGCKRCVPKHCDCNYVSHYCGVYVWVSPGPGRNELAKLTLAILDYATNVPPVKPTKEVVYYIDTAGRPTTSVKSVGKVTAVITIGDAHRNILFEKPKSPRAAAVHSATLQKLTGDVSKLEVDFLKMSPLTALNQLTPEIIRGLTGEAKTTHEQLEEARGRLLREIQQSEPPEPLPAPRPFFRSPGLLEIEQRLQTVR